VRDVARDPGVEAWLTLRRRIYLDTGTLQTMYDYGETLWENEPFEPLRRHCKVPGLADEIDALRSIFLVNERAHFAFAVTEASGLAFHVAQATPVLETRARGDAPGMPPTSSRSEPTRSGSVPASRSNRHVARE